MYHYIYILSPLPSAAAISASLREALYRGTSLIRNRHSHR